MQMVHVDSGIFLDRNEIAARFFQVDCCETNLRTDAGGERLLLEKSGKRFRIIFCRKVEGDRC